MEDKPQNRPLAVPSGRLTRATRLGGMTAGLAGNMALGGLVQLGRGQRPKMRDLLLTPRNITRVADELARMRGAAMKIGQLVSMDSGDVLPPELAQIMARLRADAHFMPPAQLKQVLNTQWPTGWLGRFARFDVRPMAAASIGQVHRAQTKDGRDLAIKVQYPGVAQSIDADVANVGALIKLSGLLPKGFDLAPYLEEGRQQLHEETDYAREGRYLDRFGSLLAGDARFTLPVLQPDWTTPQILAMGFVEGVPIEAAIDLPQADRDRIAHDLIELLLWELFTAHLMQTDPNFANYRYNPDTGRIVLLDFGATREIAPAIAAHYKALMRAGMAGCAAAMRDAAMAIGFISPEVAERHAARIMAMMELVFDALRSGAIYDFSDTTLSAAMQKEGIALAEDGFIPPPLPVDVLFLQRKFGGVFLLAARLRAQVDVRKLLARYLA